jgi:hypothetical protein
MAFIAGACTQGESRDAPESEGVEQPMSERTNPTPEPVAEVLVPQGTTLAFRVDRTVSTESDDVGDAFTATVTDATRAAVGSEALAPGARSRWVVTRSDSDAGDDGEALLAFRLESLQVAGEWVPIEGTVTETELRADTGDSNSETAAKVAVGAAAGAILGRIIGGNTSSTLKGAGVGAAVGTVVALTTRDGSAELPEGSMITIRLDEDVVDR